jgi:hypothetical protein
MMSRALVAYLPAHAEPPEASRFHGMACCDMGRVARTYRVFHEVPVRTNLLLPVRPERAPGGTDGPRLWGQYLHRIAVVLDPGCLREDGAASDAAYETADLICRYFLGQHQALCGIVHDDKSERDIARTEALVARKGRITRREILRAIRIDAWTLDSRVKPTLVGRGSVIVARGERKNQEVWTSHRPLCQPDGFWPTWPARPRPQSDDLDGIKGSEADGVESTETEDRNFDDLVFG